jgi:gamma-glutamyltranspeptidase/glutathione hydrolase
VVAGWASLLDRYGTLQLDRLLRPAIEHARRGVPVSVMLAAVIESIGRGTGAYGAKPSDGFTADPRTSELLMPGGVPLRPGELLVQHELAATLDTIAREGPKAFYRGEIARSIVDACAAAGGHITYEDLAGIEARWTPSLRVSHGGYEVHTTGSQLLETSALLAGSGLAGLGLHSPAHLHIVIECLKLAQADRVANHSDDRFDPTALLTAQHLESRRAAIRPERAARATGDEPLGRAAAPAGTTTLVTADRHGNLCAVLQTLGRHFGGRTLVGETGMLLNNLFGHSFRTQRTNSTGGPSVVLTPQGAPFMAVGSVGGPSIPQTVPQVISNVIDFRLNPQAAVEAPRVRVFSDYRVMIEARIAEDVRASLLARGHELDVVGEWAFGEGQLGRVQLVVRGADTTLHAASDPRGSGAAAAW